MIACPHCKARSSWVVDKRNKPDGRIQRRRQCDECGFRYSTCEVLLPEGKRKAAGELLRRLQAAQP